MNQLRTIARLDGTKLSTGLVLILVLSIAWPSVDIGNLGKDLVESTGVVTGSQIDAVVKATGKLDQATNTLTDEQEYYLGRSVSAMILRQYPLYRGNPAMTKYLNQVGQALAARSSRPEIFGGYHFAILDTDQINALSAPGGFIFVSRGFLSVINSEESLAGVLAHEIGHVVLGHGVKAISQGKVSEALLILGKEAVSSYGSSELAAVTQVFGDSVNQVCDTVMKTGYSRSQEYEADDFAAKLMAKTGYDTRGLVAMLDEVGIAASRSRGGWLDTHPAAVDRKLSLKVLKQKGVEGGVVTRTARFVEVKQ